jgi:hypothetical protein
MIMIQIIIMVVVVGMVKYFYKSSMEDEDIGETTTESSGSAVPATGLNDKYPRDEPLDSGIDAPMPDDVPFDCCGPGVTMLRSNTFVDPNQETFLLTRPGRVLCFIVVVSLVMYRLTSSRFLHSSFNRKISFVSHVSSLISFLAIPSS